MEFWGIEIGYRIFRLGGELNTQLAHKLVPMLRELHAV